VIWIPIPVDYVPAFRLALSVTALPARAIMILIYANLPLSVSPVGFLVEFGMLYERTTHHFYINCIERFAGYGRDRPCFG